MALKEAKGTDPLSVFVAIGCSFGGKYWGGYARRKEGKPQHNYARGAVRSIDKKLAKLEGKNIKFSDIDYRDIEILSGDVIYCDPPYVGTTGYRTGEFNHSEFWQWAEVVAESNPIYVSEFTDRSNWKTVWTRDRDVKMDSTGPFLKKTELLLYKGPEV